MRDVRHGATEIEEKASDFDAQLYNHLLIQQNYA